MKEILNILVIEDNPADIRLIQEAFKSLVLDYKLHFANDGIEALSFLHKEDKFKDMPEPHLIFLDLNLPIKNGYEVLQEIKNDNFLKHIPIIILSSSDREVLKSYTCAANSYLMKPMDYDKFISMVQAVETFWFENAKLPVNYN